VREFKDWYAYSKKLEDAIAQLNQRIHALEAENLSLVEKLEKCQLELDDTLKKLSLNMESQLIIPEMKDKGHGNINVINQNKKDGGATGRARQRFKSVVTSSQFVKRNDLTLQIEEIEKDAEGFSQGLVPVPGGGGNIKSDSQEDSPIREGPQPY
jgi:hypothetical protein